MTESTAPDVTVWHRTVPFDELEEEEPLGVKVGDIPVAIVRVGDSVFALHDECTHEVAPLSDGFVEDGCIECPLHQGTFDLTSGEARSAPCTVPVKVYAVRVVEGIVEVSAG